jgi:tape measure domain-containing protein
MAEVVVNFRAAGDEDVLRASKTVAKSVADLKRLAQTPIETKFAQGQIPQGFDRLKAQVVSAREELKRLNEEMGKPMKMGAAPKIQKPVDPLAAANASMADMRKTAATPIESSAFKTAAGANFDSIRDRVMAARQAVTQFNQELGKAPNVKIDFAAAVEKQVNMATAKIQNMKRLAATPIESSAFRSSMGNAGFAKVQSDVLRARTELAQFNKELGNTAKQGQVAGGSLGFISRLLVAMAVRKVAHEIVELADQYTSLQNKLRTVTDSQASLNVATSDMIRIANSARSPLSAVTTVYARTARSVQQLGKSQMEVTQFTETLSKAIQIGGSTTAEAGNAMIQLSQGLASGTLRGDELRSVLEQMPIVAEFIEKKLGVTRGELRKLGAEGKITSEVVFDAMLEATESVNKQFAELRPTISQSFEVLKNKFLVAIGESSELTGKLSDAVMLVANNFDIAINAAGALAAAMTTLTVINVGKMAAGFALANPWIAATVAIVGATTALVAFKDQIKVGATDASTLGTVFKVFTDQFKTGLKETGAQLSYSSDVISDMSRGFGIMGDAASGVRDNIVDGILKPLEMSGFIAARTAKIVSEIGSGKKTREEINQELVTDFFPKFMGEPREVKDAFGNISIEAGKVEYEWGLMAARMKDALGAVFSPDGWDALAGAIVGIKPAQDAFIENQNAYLYEITVGAANKAQAEWEKKYRETTERFNLWAKDKLPPEPGTVTNSPDKKKGKKEHGKTIAELITETNRQIEIDGMGVLEREIAKAIDGGLKELKPSIQAALKGVSAMNAEIKAAKRVWAEADLKAEINGSNPYKQAMLKTNLDKQLEGIKAKYAAAQKEWQSFVDIVTNAEQIQQANEFMKELDKLAELARKKGREVSEAFAKGYAEEEKRKKEVKDTYNQDKWGRQADSADKREGIMGTLNPKLAKMQEIQDMENFRNDMKDFPDWVAYATERIRELKTEMQLEGPFMDFANQMKGIFGPGGAMVRGFADVAARAVVMNMSLRDTKAAMRELLDSVQQQALSSLFQLPMNLLLSPSTYAGAAPSPTGSTTSWAGAANKPPGWATGGYTGNGGVNDPAGIVHGQEYVVNADATRKYRPMLEAINKGAPVPSVGAKAGSSAGSAPVINITNNVGADVQARVSPTTGEIEVMINQAMAKNTDKYVASSIQNPNSKTSRAMGVHVGTGERRRGA